MSATFKGGLHIHDYKEFTNKVPVRALPGCPEHVFPLRQHIGAPISPIVHAGDKVCVGQKIADAEEFMSVPLHSSVSGTVKELRKSVQSNGTTVDAIVIENDGQDTLWEGIHPAQTYYELTSKEALWVIREAGIVGMGGAGFPTHVKLATDKKIKFLIVNGAECEPFLTSDHRRMLEHPDEIIDGLKIAMHVLGLREGYIGIESNKKDGISALRSSKRYNTKIHIETLKTKYPQGAEKQLIKAITGRSVPPGKLPADVGAVVLNIDTVFAISRAFRTGMPAVRRVVTVSGDCVKNPSNFDVPTGVPVSYLFEQAGGFTAQPQKIIMGGPMMGFTQFSLDTPVTKTTSSVLALEKAPQIYDPDAPCIRCGKCVSHCPMQLMPNYLSRFALEGNVEMADRYHLLDCIECGLCSYLCPAKQNMLHNIRVMKPEVAAYRKKKQEEKSHG